MTSELESLQYGGRKVPPLMGVEVSGALGCPGLWAIPPSRCCHHNESIGDFVGIGPEARNLLLCLARPALTIPTFRGWLLGWHAVERSLVPGPESGWEKPPHFPDDYARQKCQQLLLSTYFSNKLIQGVGGNTKFKNSRQKK